jgi:hypothetical protein
LGCKLSGIFLRAGLDSFLLICPSCQLVASASGGLALRSKQISRQQNQEVVRKMRAKPFRLSHAGRTFSARNGPPFCHEMAPDISSAGLQSRRPSRCHNVLGGRFQLGQSANHLGQRFADSFEAWRISSTSPQPRRCLTTPQEHHSQSGGARLHAVRHLPGEAAPVWPWSYNSSARGRLVGGFGSSKPA